MREPTLRETADAMDPAGREDAPKPRIYPKAMRCACDNLLPPGDPYAGLCWPCLMNERMMEGKDER